MGYVIGQHFQQTTSIRFLTVNVLKQVKGAYFLQTSRFFSRFSCLRYGIPFPVFARSSFGSAGAHFCTLSRGEDEIH